MVISSGSRKLKEMFHTQPWFRDIETDSLGRIIVYVTDLSSSVVSAIPSTIEGQHVLVHFASSKDIDKNKYVNVLPLVEVSKEDEDPVPNMEYLTERLVFLRKEYDNDVLDQIFFEVHDGNNALTKLSIKHPEVRKLMEELYETYGFDVLYEEIG